MTGGMYCVHTPAGNQRAGKSLQTLIDLGGGQFIVVN